MPSVVLDCPPCAADLVIRPGVRQFACAHCGTGIKVEISGGIISPSVPVRDSVQGINQSAEKIAAEMAITRLREELRQEVVRLNTLRSGGGLERGVRAFSNTIGLMVKTMFRQFVLLCSAIIGVGCPSRRLRNHRYWLSQ